MILQSGGPETIWGLLLCSPGHGWKLGDGTSSPEQDVSVTVLPAVDPVTFRKSTAQHKFT